MGDEKVSFGSLIFLFLFMPVSLLLYYVVPGPFKKAVLILLSFLFYAWGRPEHLVVLALSILFNYFSASEMLRWKQNGSIMMARIALFGAIAVDIAVLAVFKYTSIGLPLGISFYTFSIISYLADLYLEKAGRADNLVNFALYVSFFPKISSGPIVSYQEFEDQLLTAKPGLVSIQDGLYQFLIGLFKKILIADALGSAFARVTSLTAMATATAWLGALFYFLQLYFDFSGYSDMAIGLSRMFGFRFGKNFDYPYLSVNISEFWRRWHISLGAWFRNYVYIPLGGNRCSTLMQVRNLLAVWILTGIWHGSTLNFLIWGLYHGAFAMLERFVLKDKVEMFPKVLRILVTDLIVYFGWVMFFSPSMGEAVRYYGLMFGAGSLGFWNKTTTFLLMEKLPLLIIAAALCGPWIYSLHESFAFKRGGVYRTISVLMFAALFLVCTAGIVGSTYTSFLYVKF